MRKSLEKALNQHYTVQFEFNVQELEKISGIKLDQYNFQSDLEDKLKQKGFHEPYVSNSSIQIKTKKYDKAMKSKIGNVLMEVIKDLKGLENVC